MFPPLVTIHPSNIPIFGSDVGRLGSLEGKSISKPLNRSIAAANFLSAFSDLLSPASVADFNASSAAINTLLFISQWNWV
jgi:hypothetical protein